ncbi:MULTISPECIES: N-acetylglucosamine-6-phosphate deacetylase [Rhizobium/Agrobacterium group]|uniref:N-acetylglucosamine-6-phosphate deacetylase n=1 Tax=Agrobacterium genomosp. 2 str. CFBP 5494 TaxID=1183436 RepID=A0A9W5F3F3_9HYPH|nr:MULTISPECIES: N-acetylglucosamine-6-phosphate deacetylase [Rhizobium/Agrobacterium group]RSC21363.1 N-acetylglucosamine-6-phosphate deacetylase [Agrobacterium sp. FDAARGOS_525]RSC21501.1 N-acetylglucosamine-6-phosphate deacetylase [Agrobacterium sp. FDAARGOS_525]CAD7054596.1 N-acetylglucosamine-6-phosphate deacetylase [Rhizobium sp. P007]CDN95446.1 N-acetylglucosamine-6-phosphate deacetylase [Agrobacterium tumefaciens]CUX03193.1 N-acetylglucosamine-6-phosphate deacetylase [Agrobacterium gen
MTITALTAARIFDGNAMRDEAAILIRDGMVVDLASRAEIPADCFVRDLGIGVVAPGFIDLQVNGGGGVMLNDGPSAATMAAIAAAHRPFGTTGLLPTLITDTKAITDAAIEAAAQAVGNVPGVLGLHLEGPHLAPARKGAHLAELMRPMSDADVEQLISARERIGVLLVTVAVEQVGPRLIRRLAEAGVIVSLGHTDADYDSTMAAIDAGARSATHLFNAMTQLGNRDPGVVGAVLASPTVSAGIIADGHHVHPESLRAALAAKRAPGRLYLVTDAMASVGMEGDSFVLNQRTVHRRDGRLTLSDGTLAGADIDMSATVRFAVANLGLSVEEVLRMASLYPAELIGDGRRGRIEPGAAAEFVHLDDDLTVRDILAP